MLSSVCVWISGDGASGGVIPELGVTKKLIIINNERKEVMM